MTIWNFVSLIVFIFWNIILLYALFRDPSVRSRILRMMAVFLLWKTFPHGAWFSFSSFMEDFQAAQPIWLTLALSLLAVIYLYGFISLLKERKN